MKKLIMSFVYAFAGIWHCIKNERNFRIHIYAMTTVLGLLPRYTLTSGERAAIYIVMALVFACEAFNTAIEHLADSVTKENSPAIRICKDASAGAVLISAICAVFVAWQILWDTEILGRFVADCFSSALNVVILVLYIIAGVFFIFLPERKKK